MLLTFLASSSVRYRGNIVLTEMINLPIYTLLPKSQQTENSYIETYFKTVL
jgi:hypothetical protein